MNKHQMIKALKQELKLFAAEISEKKRQRKGSPDGFVEGLFNLKFEYRHHHIAYCLIRGRTMNQIEKNFNPNNYMPVMSYVEQIKSTWMEKINEEIIRDCAA